MGLMLLSRTVFVFYKRLAMNVFPKALFGFLGFYLAFGVAAYAAPVQSLTPGTMLVFPKFDVGADSKTQLRVNNTGSSAIRFHYNYVCPGIPRGDDSCAKLDRTKSLTPHQTLLIDVASENPPCDRGFIIGYAVDQATRPVSFNHLLGTYNISAGRRLSSDNAFSIQSVRAEFQALGGPNGFSFTPGLDQDFAEIGATFVSDFRANPDVAVGSRLVLLDIGASLGRRNPISSATVDFWNSAEEPFSSSWEFVCWTEVSLDQIDANFLSDNLGTLYGSMRIESSLSCPVAGLCPPFLPRAPLLLAVIQEGESDGLLRQQANSSAASGGGEGSALRSMMSIPCNDGDADSLDYFDPTLGCTSLTPYRQDCEGQKQRAEQLANNFYGRCLAGCFNDTLCENGCSPGIDRLRAFINVRYSSCTSNPTKSCEELALEDRNYCQNVFDGPQTCAVVCNGAGLACFEACVEAADCSAMALQSADFCQRSKCIAEGGTSDTCPTGLVQDCDKQLEEMTEYRLSEVSSCINDYCPTLDPAQRPACIFGCNFGGQLLEVSSFPVLKASCEATANGTCQEVKDEQWAHPCSGGVNVNECRCLDTNPTCTQACLQVATCASAIDAWYGVCQAEAN